MPSVPRREPNQVRSAGIPSAQVPTDAPAGAFGGGPALESVNRASQQLSNTIGDIFIAEKQKADETALVEFDAKATKFETDLLYAPKHGALNKQGKDALSVYEPTQKAYKEGMDEMIKGLSDSGQKAAATNLAQKRWLSIDRNLQQHMSQESKRHAVQVTEAKISNATQLAVVGLSGPDPMGNIKTQIEQSQAAVQVMASNIGFDEAQTKEAEQKAVSSIHTAVLSSYLGQDRARDAQKYFKANKGSLEPKAAAQLEPMIDKRVLEENVAAISKKAVTLNVNENGVDLTAAVHTATVEAKKLGLDEQETVAAIAATQNRASIAEAQINDQRKLNDRAFVNDAIALQRKGHTYDQAEKMLFKEMGPTNSGYGYDDADRIKKHSELVALYSKPESFYDDALKKMDLNQQNAWNQIEIMAQGKYGTDTVTLPDSGINVKAKDIFLSEMKRIVPGMAADNMIKTAQEKMKDVVVNPGAWWKTKQPAYLKSYSERMATIAAVEKMRGDYPPGVVDAAQTSAKSRLGREATPAEIRTRIKELQDSGKLPR